jgi:hypothetical protein
MLLLAIAVAPHARSTTKEATISDKSNYQVEKAAAALQSNKVLQSPNEKSKAEEQDE